MVKLSVSTEVSKGPQKAQLDGTCEASIEKETVVHLKARPRCTRYAVGAFIAILIILSVAGALLGVFLYKHHESRQCIDWGPGCGMEEPPVFLKHDVDPLQHGGDNDDERVKVEFHVGFGNVDEDGNDKTNQQNRGPPHADDPHHPGRGAPPHDPDNYHPRPSNSGHRLPPKNRPYPPGPAGPQDKERHHGHNRRHHPIP